MSMILGLITSLLILLMAFSGPTPPQPPSNSGRNIVVIMTDDQDVDSLPVMRNLMSHPEGSWVRFENAFTNDSLCCPSRSTFLTGQYSHHHGVISNAAKHTSKLDDKNTLATWLDDAGYDTAIMGKYLNKITSPKPGWDTWSVGKGSADFRTEQAVNYIEATTSSHPFFLFLSYASPHTPATPPTRYKNADVFVPPHDVSYLEADVSDKPLWIRKLPIPGSSVLTKWETERLNSQRELLAVDDGVQDVIDALKKRGVLDNTLVIYLSDHGFSWGDHRLFYKHCAYDECGHFPLLIRYPGQVGNRVEDTFVSNVSLASTIAEWAGVAPQRPQDAASLMPLLNGVSAGWNQTLLIEKRAGQPSLGKFWGIRTPEWAYAEYDNGDTELYDMNADPFQLNNLAGNADYQDEVGVLSDILDGMK